MLRLIFFLITAALLLYSTRTSTPCTLWGSTGSVNQTGKVTFVVKNRDWKPNRNKVLKIVRPDNGYQYLCLYAAGDDEPGLKAGINRKGLVVIRASASSITMVYIKVKNPGENEKVLSYQLDDVFWRQTELAQ